MGNGTFLAQGFTGETAAASVENKVMVEHNPPVFIEHVHKLVFDFDRILRGGPPQATGQPTH
ncbi:MAG TPA: hypothetical protein VK054_09385, partial [Beutenbergiaceae bacterium]|nr:hypothetical protein [Beutenbergiaceae bacterium]